MEQIIDPDENVAALAEAQGIEVKEEVTILELLNGKKVKVRYLPQSIASTLEFDNGTPIPPGTRRQVYDMNRSMRDLLPKMNALALKNIEIVNDCDPKAIYGPRSLKLSAIGPGEFYRLRDLCFPPSSGDASNSEYEDIRDNRPHRKGMRKDSVAPGA